MISFSRLIPQPIRRKIINRLTSWTTASYSQSGEDRIISFLLGTCGLNNCTYMDIGSSHPINGNNTYLLYRQGMRGTCVDPTPGLSQLYQTMRPEDDFISGAVVPGDEETVTIQQFRESTLNTVSISSAEQYDQFGYGRREAIQVSALRIQQLFERGRAGVPDVLCVDIEGVDYEVLESMSITSRPKIICVETVTYLPDKTPVIDQRFASMLASKGFVKYADTYINQIFVDKDVMRRQRFV